MFNLCIQKSTIKILTFSALVDIAKTNKIIHNTHTNERIIVEVSQNLSNVELGIRKSRSFASRHFTRGLQCQKGIGTVPFRKAGLVQSSLQITDKVNLSNKCDSK